MSKAGELRDVIKMAMRRANEGEATKAAVRAGRVKKPVTREPRDYRVPLASYAVGTGAAAALYARNNPRKKTRNRRNDGTEAQMGIKP